VSGDLIVKPVDTAAAVGETVTLTCSSNLSDLSILWSFNGTNYKHWGIVHKGDLVIVNVTFNDSGLYTCVDDEGLQSALDEGHFGSAHLVVYGRLGDRLSYICVHSCFEFIEVKQFKIIMLEAEGNLN